MMPKVIDRPVFEPRPQDFPDDPFALGWRYVPHTCSNGQVYQRRVPLTLDDILHPQIGDFRVHSRDHEHFCTYLYNIFEEQLRHDPSAVVLHDVRVAWATPGLDPHGPDISVIFGVKEDRNWSTFYEMEEQTKPTLIVEVTSLGTRKTDLEDKVREYAQAGVSYYIIVDAYQKKLSKRRLLGYELGQQGYVRMKANHRGWLWLPPLGIWLGLENGKPCGYDVRGRRISSHVENKVALIAERKARQEAEAQLRQLEAELRRLRGHPLPPEDIPKMPDESL